MKKAASFNEWPEIIQDVIVGMQGGGGDLSCCSFTWKGVN